MLNLSNQSIKDQVGHDSLSSLRALRTPSGGKILLRWLIAFLLSFLVLLFLPWQQNIRGNGQVTALKPEHRPQTVQAVIAGRIEKWHISEGDYVNQGDTIVTISEVKEKYFDPNLMVRLQQQLSAKENSLQAKRDKASALEQQIAALRKAWHYKIEQAKSKILAEEIRFKNAENQYQRNKSLFEAGNIPLTKFQELEYKYRSSETELQNARFELDRLDAEYSEKISKSISELNNTQSDAFDTEVDIAKARNELVNTSMRNAQYQILAPQDGYVVRAMKTGLQETLKEGDAICTIMPEANDLAVEMYVKAMDVPLISKGRHARIQFDGWPALQFSGWPSVSVGTFGGTVHVIDYVNTRPGEFRILIVPDNHREPWPPKLRVGSGTKGWVMLNDVPLWYELWRQLNGFPASLYAQPEDNGNDKKAKKAKDEKL